MLEMATCTHVCRLCKAAVPLNRSVTLFSRGSIQRQLPSRISDLLDVRVDANDGLPLHMCCKCKTRLESLEKAAQDLEDFRKQARDSYEELTAWRSSEALQREQWGGRGVARYNKSKASGQEADNGQLQATGLWPKHEHPRL